MLFIELPFNWYNLSSSNATETVLPVDQWRQCDLSGQKYTPWEISGLQAANTDMNAPSSCRYTIVPRSHVQKGAKGRVFRLRVEPSERKKKKEEDR